MEIADSAGSGHSRRHTVKVEGWEAEAQGRGEQHPLSRDGWAYVEGANVHPGGRAAIGTRVN